MVVTLTLSWRAIPLHSHTSITCENDDFVAIFSAKNVSKLTSVLICQKPFWESFDSMQSDIDPENEDNLPDGDQNKFATTMSGIVSSNNIAIIV